MFKFFTKSIYIMFIFDFMSFVISTLGWYHYFSLPLNILPITISLILFTGMFSLYLKANYKIREFNITGKNTYLLLEAVIFAHIPPAIPLLMYTSFMKTVLFLSINLITIFILLRLYRALFHIYLFKIKKEKNVLIIGTNKEAKIIAEEIVNKRALKMKVVGFIGDKYDGKIIETSEFPIYKYPADIKKIIYENNVDIIIISVKRRMEESMLSEMIFDIPNNVDIYKMADFYELITNKCYVDKMTTNWLFYDYMNKRSRIYDFCKRAFDIISALIILIVTFPILLYIGIRVKLTDGGNPIYTQNRVGRGGKIFKAYKLRTMYVNDYTPTNGEIDTNTSGINDDRVIPFCKFVRRARFDEIPQMINILKGEMSIVGPRTEWEALVNIYSKEIPYYQCRQWVRTGWTGWAQINQGHCVMNDDIAEKLQYDLYYLKHRNIFWEICILVKAVFLALGGRHG